MGNETNKNTFKYYVRYNGEDLPSNLWVRDLGSNDPYELATEMHKREKLPYYRIHMNDGTEEDYEKWIEKHPTELDEVYVTAPAPAPRRIAETPKHYPKLKIQGWYNPNLADGIGMYPIKFGPAFGQHSTTYISNYLSHKNPTLIPLDNVRRMYKGSKGYNLFNEFVEDNNNTIRQAEDFINTTDVLLGDNEIPLSNISLFGGIEDGKFKIGNINSFYGGTTVIPVRNKYVGKVKEVLNNDGDVSFVTELNDTIPTDLDFSGKMIFGDELGNSYFVYDLLDPEILSRVNRILKKDPLYPMMIDNGRYEYFDTKPSSTEFYTTPFDDPNNMYIVGR